MCKVANNDKKMEFVFLFILTEDLVPGRFPCFTTGSWPTSEVFDDIFHLNYRLIGDCDAWNCPIQSSTFLKIVKKLILEVEFFFYVILALNIISDIVRFMWSKIMCNPLGI